MKGYSKLLFWVLALMLAIIAAFSAVTLSYRGRQADAVMLNDMVCAAREQWSTIEAFDCERYAEEMLIFDSVDTLRVSTADRLLAGADSPVKAQQMGHLCLPVHDGSRFMGTIVIPDPAKAGYDVARRRLIEAAVVLLIGMLLVGVLYGAYVRHAIVRPFRQMERFAANVAAGDLDTPLQYEEDGLFGVFTASFDIMREELKAARERELAIKLKERELIASLSHDLKTPITGIKLLCELMAVKVQDGYVLTKIESIHQKAEQINVLVADLLSSALDELGEMQVRCQDEESAMLHELVEEHDPRGLAREEAVPPCLLHVDRSRLSQIVGNVLSNSYKYAGTAIDIGYRLREGYLEMTVRDYGEGVPEQEIGLVTTKYYRGENAAGKDGSGLGLYIASLLMEKMGGELICACRDKGFLVTLLLPLS